ncbi:hypothetical protein TWF481_007218 [Arthrobotrys musiformis]|uniref:Uncharacterized protein n=1 Tax=Arthrobotrys musiformis TaxID=47236 RepID=A0AAV9WAV1_9PEZI
MYASGMMARDQSIMPGYDADSSEDDNSRHSSIFQASLYLVEDGKQSTSALGPGSPPASSHDEVAALSTSIDSCATLVPNTSDAVTINYVDGGPLGVDLDLDLDDPKAEPLYIYTSPMEPTERPPTMPAPPAQKRAEALAEILFRQDMQTYGLHVSTSAAAMSYIRRSEYHEALRATEFNFRAIQSQQRGYGDLRNHPFSRAVREDAPLLRPGAWINSENERERRRQQRRGQSTGQERVDGNTGNWESGVWGGFLAILCCMAIPINDYARETQGDWY